MEVTRTTSFDVKLSEAEARSLVMAVTRFLNLVDDLPIGSSARLQIVNSGAVDKLLALSMALKSAGLEQ